MITSNKTDQGGYLYPSASSSIMTTATATVTINEVSPSEHGITLNRSMSSSSAVVINRNNNNAISTTATGTNVKRRIQKVTNELSQIISSSSLHLNQTPTPSSSSSSTTTPSSTSLPTPTLSSWNEYQMKNGDFVVIGNSNSTNGLTPTSNGTHSNIPISTTSVVRSSSLYSIASSPPSSVKSSSSIRSLSSNENNNNSGNKMTNNSNSNSNNKSKSNSSDYPYGADDRYIDNNILSPHAISGIDRNRIELNPKCLKISTPISQKQNRNDVNSNTNNNNVNDYHHDSSCSKVDDDGKDNSDSRDCDTVYIGKETISNSHYYSLPAYPYPCSTDHEERRNDLLQSINLIESDELDTPLTNIINTVNKLLPSSTSCSVNIVGKEKVWIKSKLNIPFSSVSRDVSLCNYVILDEAEDVVQLRPFHDKFLVSNPIVQRLNIHFYAGSPIKLEGVKVGALVVFYTEDRPFFNESEKQILQSMAMVVSDLFKQHEKRITETNNTQKLMREKNLYLQSLSSMITGIFVVDRSTPDLRIFSTNTGACKLFGCHESQLIDKPLDDIVKGKRTSMEEYIKLRSAVQLGQTATVVILSDKLNRPCLNTSTATSTTSSPLPTSFWARYCVHSLSPINSSSPSSGNTNGGHHRNSNNSLDLDRYCFVEIFNEDRMVQAKDEIEKNRETTSLQIDAQRITIINLAREVRARMDMIVDSGTTIMSAFGNPQQLQMQQPHVDQNKLINLSRSIVENGLYLTGLINSIAMHQISGGVQVPSFDHQQQQQQPQGHYEDGYGKNDLDTIKRFSVDNNDDRSDSFSSFESARKRAKQEGRG